MRSGAGNAILLTFMLTVVARGCRAQKATLHFAFQLAARLRGTSQGEWAVDTRRLQDRLDDLPPELDAEEAEALSYIGEAWEDAVGDGIDPRTLANAALFAAFAELVEAYGENAVISMVEGLKARLRRGEFTFRRALH